MSDDEMQIDDIENDTMPFSAGDMVELHSLSKNDFNGLVGEVGEFMEEKERYRITLPTKKVAIRVKNLQKCEDQGLARQKYLNKKLKHESDKILAKGFRQVNSAQEQRILMMLGAIFILLITSTLYSTGALSYIYYDSFAASYLQIAGEPIKDYALVPVYENVLIPLNNHVVSPINEIIVQPVLGFVDKIANMFSEYIFTPLYNVVSPVVNSVSGVIDGVKNTVSSIISSVIGGSDSGASTTTATENLMGDGVEDIATEVLNNDLVEEVEHSDL